MILPVALRRPGASHDSDSMIIMMCACDTDHDHRDSESELVPVTVSVRHSDRQGHCHCDSDRRPARAAALLGVGSRRAPGWRPAGLRRLSHGNRDSDTDSWLSLNNIPGYPRLAERVSRRRSNVYKRWAGIHLKFPLQFPAKVQGMTMHILLCKLLLDCLPMWRPWMKSFIVPSWRPWVKSSIVPSQCGVHE